MRTHGGFIRFAINCKGCKKLMPRTNSSKRFCYNCIEKGKHLGWMADSRYERFRRKLIK